MFIAGNYFGIYDKL